MRSRRTTPKAVIFGDRTLNDSQTLPSDSGTQYLPLSRRPSGSVASFAWRAPSRRSALLVRQPTHDRRKLHRVGTARRTARKQRVSSFWAVGVRWNVMNEVHEPQDLRQLLTCLKITSGTTSNSNFALSRILNMYKYPDDAATESRGAELMSLANPDPQSGRTLSSNIGLELGFLRNRINARAPRTTATSYPGGLSCPRRDSRPTRPSQGDDGNKGFSTSNLGNTHRTRTAVQLLREQAAQPTNKLFQPLGGPQRTTTSRSWRARRRPIKIENVFHLFEKAVAHGDLRRARPTNIDRTGRENIHHQNSKRTFT